jgi:protein TonB
VPGPGWGDGPPGAGAIEWPRAISQVKPQYTSEAMHAKLQGMVTLEALVLPDGSVGEVKVVRSLDPIFGLDQAAIAAVKQWRFQPGKQGGRSIPVLVTIELTFTLR